MAEYLGLAMDIGAYLLFSRLETQLKANLYEIRDNVPVFHSHAALKRELQRSAEGEIPYARLDGRAEPTGQPLYTGKSGGGSEKGSGSGKNGGSGGDDTAIVRITDKFRVKRDRCPADRSRWTTMVERKLESEVESVPFCLALRKDAGVYTSADKIHKLKQFGQTVFFADFDKIGNSVRREAKIFGKKFFPDEECHTSYELSKLGSRSGVQTEEYLVKSGGALTAIGRVSWADENRKQIQIGAPTAATVSATAAASAAASTTSKGDFSAPDHQHHYRLILTGDVDAVLANMEDEAHRYNVGRRAAIVVGVVLAYMAWDRLARDFAEWRKRNKR